MSQLQVTGEAKIRDIQGPVVANSGVVTALDGDASQYVRGDGTLADFPTSTGGGSSVSYYLNSSVSQGTIGGVSYRQLGKTPIAGAGTDITILANGYVASYLTDANDPALLEVPAGNFNCEFYFSVNSDAHNPFVYAEVYKYDGTTFTLIGSSQSVPEYLTNGTTLSPYYFAIPVAQTVLAITDRIAIRIYVNVDGRTVTLHTENNHLCQVVTTFSKGLTSLNNLTRQVQFLATGTSGTDFNISSATATHTFNIPSASETNRGLVTIASQSFAGIKTFNDAIKGEVGVLLKNGVISSSNGYTALNAFENTLIITSLISGTPFSNNLEFAPSTSNTYTFPNASGTLALTSNLSSYVPYTGANSNVDLGLYSLFANDLFANGNGTNNANLYLKQGTASLLIQNGYSNILATGTKIGFQVATSAIAAYYADLQFSSLTDNRTYTLPDLSGTLALLEGSQTFSGAKTFSATPTIDGGFSTAIPLRFKQYDAATFNADGYTDLYVINAYRFGFSFNQGSGNYKGFTFNASGITLNTARDYIMPDASGTLALTSDLSGYVTLATNQTITGAKIFTSAITNNQGYILKDLGAGGYLSVTAGFGGFSYNNTVAGFARYNFSESNGSISILNFPTSVSSKLYTFPDASGTLALTSNLSSYVPYTGATTDVNLGARNLSSYGINVNGDGTNGGALNLKMYNSLTLGGVGYLSIYAQTDNYFALAWNFIGGVKQAIFSNASIPINTTRYYNLPNADGTLALTSDLGAYLPLTGGTLTGALSGTSATFSAGVVSQGAYTGFQYNSAGAYPAYNTYFGAIGTNFSNSNSELDIWNTVGGGFVFRKQTGASAQTALFTIASSGAATFSSSVTSNKTSGATFVAASGTTSNIYSYLLNTGGNLFLGVEQSSGGGIFAGSSAYASIIGSSAATSMQFATNDTVKMTITSGGNVGIGTSAVNAKLEVAATYASDTTPEIIFRDGTGVALNFGGTANGSKFLQAQDSSGVSTYYNLLLNPSGGNVGIGNSGESIYRLAVKSVDSGSGNWNILLSNSSDTVLFRIRNDGAFFTGTASSSPYNNTSGGSANLIVTSGGSLERSTSSLKYKTDIRNYDKGIAEVMQMRPVYYKGKGENDGNKQYAGLIAEEIHELGLTEFVQYAEDGSPDALAYSNMVSLLVKAIQESHEIIKDLEARIKQLENK